jgi:hypothetical protein
MSTSAVRATFIAIVLGSFAIGGLLGWGLNKLVHVPYPWADIVALATVVVVSGFTNTPAGGSMMTTWITYALVAAFFLLAVYHRSRKPKEA